MCYPYESQEPKGKTGAVYGRAPTSEKRYENVLLRVCNMCMCI